MTPRRFDWTLRTRGAAVAGWPAAERDAALLLLRRDAAARRMLADMLAAEDGEEDTAGLGAARGRVLGAVRRALRPPPPVLRGVRWGAVAACLLAGLYLGLPGADAEGAAPGSALGPTFQSTPAATVLAALDD